MKEKLKMLVVMMVLAALVFALPVLAEVVPEGIEAPVGETLA